MFEEKRHIDLRLPRSWNDCSTEELRTVARVLMSCASKATRYKPFSLKEVKIALFFAFTGLEIVEPINPRVDVERQYYVVRFRDKSFSWLHRAWRWCRKRLTGEDPSVFNLYLWQISSWIEPEKDLNSGRVLRAGLLDWLDCEGNNHLFVFPFQEIKRSRSWWRRKRVFRGPETLMQDFTWQRYRFVQDYMEHYVTQQNLLLQMQERGDQVSDRDLMKQEKATDLARACFLAVLYKAKIRVVEDKTQRIRVDFEYQSNQVSDYAPYFRNFPEEDWQVIRFWWEGMMFYLQTEYPRCFKRQAVKGQPKQNNPLELYTRITATMQKYLGLDETEVNSQFFQLVLQHMDNMAKENDELERIKGS